MRPVNLIPAEERRGEQAPLRTGFLVYLVVGAFVAILVAVTALVLIGNKIADSESEVARLQREDARVSLQAQRLASYTQFRILSEQRVQTVSSLADSRFDWERVMRELSLVLPGDVWLVDLTATAAPGVGVSGSGGGSGGSSLRAEVPGPALELNGCASGQQAVAGFVTTLKDIDGVTRVGIETSEVAGEESGAGVSAGGDSGSGGSGDDCRTRDFIAKFQLVVAFDAAPVPITSATEEAAPAPAAESTESGGSEEEAEGS
jgi:Tfp pilus assembly protein PilN